MVKLSVKPIFLFIIIFLAILLSLPLTISQNIKIKLAGFFSPLFKGSNYVVEKIFSVKDIFYTFTENKKLKKEVNELLIKLNKFEEVQKENERLSQLLELKRSLPHETVASRVLTRDAGTWYRTLVIDKGKNSGINIDMPVITGSGVIGRIVDCNEEISRVLLITDINSSIGAIIQDTRIVGLVEGNGNGCIVNLIPKDIDVKPQDAVVTSGFSNVFPKGLLIGTITEVYSGSQGLYNVAKIKLSSDIDRIEEVLVIKKKTP